MTFVRGKQIDKASNVDFNLHLTFWWHKNVHFSHHFSQLRELVKETLGFKSIAWIIWENANHTGYHWHNPITTNENGRFAFIQQPLSGRLNKRTLLKKNEKKRCANYIVTSLDKITGTLIPMLIFILKRKRHT